LQNPILIVLLGKVLIPSGVCSLFDRLQSRRLGRLALGRDNFRSSSSFGGFLFGCHFGWFFFRGNFVQFFFLGSPLSLQASYFWAFPPRAIPSGQCLLALLAYSFVPSGGIFFSPFLF
jgi:hypothetical protein